jgi:hypothetical protein
MIPAIAGFRLTKFVVVESLEPHEVKTGAILTALLQSLVEEHASGLIVEYRTCESAIEFQGILKALTREAQHTGHAPVLHVECHGSKSHGLELSNGSLLSWEDLAAELTELNVASQFNLLAAVSACFGGYLLGEISALKPAACWCVIAPTETIDPAEAMQGFRVFYTQLLQLQDAGKAAAALRATKLSQGEWFSQLAQLWFERLIVDYVKTHCTIEAIRERARRMYRRAREEGLPGGVGSFARRLRSQHREVLTGRYFDVFFCTERVPSSRNRFDHVRKRVEMRLNEMRNSDKFDL